MFINLLYLKFVFLIDLILFCFSNQAYTFIVLKNNSGFKLDYLQNPKLLLIQYSDLASFQKLQQMKCTLLEYFIPRHYLHERT